MSPPRRLNCPASRIPTILRFVRRRIYDEHFVVIEIDCADSGELAALLSALRKKFASIGRGRVDLTTACELPGTASIIIDHTDIGSDSENDPTVAPDENEAGIVV
jgi:hypothetical protein